MSEFQIDDLFRILRDCAGDPDRAPEGDTTFVDLGYDSLALLETAARISDEWGVELGDADVAGMERPDDLVALVNSERLDRTAS